MHKILISGASGYIGGQLASYYLQQGRPLRLLLRDASAAHAELANKCEIVAGDLTQPATLQQAVADIDSIVHCAGLLGRWGLPYRHLCEVNVQGAENLVRAAAADGVKRFLHLSAGGVTGPLGPEPVDESYSPAPETDYERSKWEGEKAVVEIAAQLGLSLLVVRPTFTYGPGDPHKLELFKAVKRGRFAFIGDGLTTIHPVYIDDLICGLDLALKSDLQGMSIILGGERPVSKRELIWGIADVLGVRRPTLKLPIWLGKLTAQSSEALARIFSFDPPVTRSRVLMMSRCWGYSIERAQKLLGYKPSVDLTEGLRRTAISYRELGWL